jgi:hypothetical protein
LEWIALRREQQYGIFAQGKKCEAIRDNYYWVMASQTSMFPWQQLDARIMGSSVLYMACGEMLEAGKSLGRPLLHQRGGPILKHLHV